MPDMDALNDEMRLVTTKLKGNKMQEKYVDFKFILDERIPREIGLEFVAIRQLAISVFAALEPEKRNRILANLSEIQSPQMQDIVKNLKLVV